jgi:hypothetical protein
MFVRIVARVNGALYAYPADAPFTQIGANMAEQRLPLPLADSYTVSFQAQLRDTSADRVVNASSRSTPTFTAASLPGDTQHYQINILNPDGSKSGDFVTVRYSFR